MSNPIDWLTGLPSKAQLNSELTASHNQHWLALIDIDQFNYVNYNFDHMVGDSYLRTLAALIIGCTDGEVDKVFRTGGEEFVILTTFIELEAYRAKLKNIQHQVAQKQLPYEHPDPSRNRLSVSITALSLTPTQITNFEELRDAMIDSIYKVKCESQKNFESFNIDLHMK